MSCKTRQVIVNSNWLMHTGTEAQGNHVTRLHFPATLCIDYVIVLQPFSSQGFDLRCQRPYRPHSPGSQGRAGGNTVGWVGALFILVGHFRPWLGRVKQQSASLLRKFLCVYWEGHVPHCHTWIVGVYVTHVLHVEGRSNQVNCPLQRAWMHPWITVM